MVGLLAGASGIVALMRVTSGRARPELEARMYTWWGIAALLYGSAWAGRGAMIAFWCMVSLLGFREFASTLPTRVSRHLLTALVLLA